MSEIFNFVFKSLSVIKQVIELIISKAQEIDNLKVKEENIAELIKEKNISKNEIDILKAKCNILEEKLEKMNDEAQNVEVEAIE
jgi:hypothetical protein